MGGLGGVSAKGFVNWELWDKNITASSSGILSRGLGSRYVCHFS